MINPSNKQTKQNYGICLHVWGKYALFTRPELKVERTSYDVMTPSAARGILEAIYWKPQIRWVIDRIHVLKPIIFQSIRRNEVGKIATKGSLSLFIEEARQQRASSVIVNPDYLIEAHFVILGDTNQDNNSAKHSEMFKRRARKGQCFHQPCLGTREFAAHFELIDSDKNLPRVNIDDQNYELGFGSPRDLGFMLWDIEHEDPNKIPLLFRATLKEGIIDVPQPGSEKIKK